MTNVVTGFANPCGGLGLAVKTLNAVQAAGNGYNFVNNVSNGNYWSAAFNAAGFLGNMSQLSRSCFAAGTPLLTPDGSKPIEQFKVGDVLLSAPEDDPAAPVVARRVEEVFHRVSPLIELRAGGRAIKTTVEHPFYVEGKGWTQAGALSPGDLLRSHEGKTIAVEGIASTDEIATVYNVQIAEHHTYFVGAPDWGFDVWAHNAACLPINGRPPHGSVDTWHNSTGTSMARQIEQTVGKGNVRWNQNLVDASKAAIAGKRPDIQYIENGLVYIIELQSPGQSWQSMLDMKSVYQSLLGSDFGGYLPIPHP